MFEDIPSETCRTCLLVQTNTVPIVNFAPYSSPISTHADVLKDLAKLKFIAEQEIKMPQNICSVCSKQLKNMYMFVKQVQECNDKLLKTLGNTKGSQEKQTDEFSEVEEDAIHIKQEHHGDERELGYNRFKSDYEGSKPNFLEVTFKTASSSEMEEINFDEETGTVDESQDNSNQTKSSNSAAEESVEEEEASGEESDNSIKTASSASDILENTSCPKCNKNLCSRKKYLQHMRREHNDNLDTDAKNKFYTCVYCTQKYDNKYNLEMHLRYKHQIDCKDDSVQNDTYTLTENNKLKCKSCDYRANTQAGLHFHKRSKHGTEDDKIKCKFCTYSSIQKFELMMHIKRTHLSRIKALRRKLGKGDRIGETSSSTEISPNSQSDDIEDISHTHNPRVCTEDCSSGDEDFIRDILKIKKRLPKSITTGSSISRRKKKKAAIADEVVFRSEKQLVIKSEASGSNAIKNTVCPLCAKALTDRDLLTHMLMEHRDECSSAYTDNSKSKKQVITCDHCSTKFTHKYDKIVHLKEEHGISTATKTKPMYTIENQIIKCRLCDYTTKTYAGLHYHTRSKHGTEDDKFKCNFCLYSCFKKFDLMHHTKRNHLSAVKAIKKDIVENRAEGETSAVEMDPNLFPTDDITSLVHKYQDVGSIDSTENNLEMSSGDEDIIRDILNMKKRVPKSGTSGSFARRCEECGNVYKNSIALNVHRRMVHREHVYSQCEYCERKYKRPYDLKLHILDKHTPKDVDSKPAPKVEREKRFMCTQCSYVCSTTTLLTIHTHRHHTGEKPYKCEFCSKAFVVPADLKTHRYLHTGERPFKCSICQKGFRDKNHMQRHKRTHSDVKPYNCLECGKGFSKNYNLTIHQRTHMKGQRLRCLVCGKYFKDRALLNVHQISENHHEEVV